MEGNGYSRPAGTSALGSRLVGHRLKLALVALGLALLAGAAPTAYVAANDSVVAEDRFSRSVTSSWGNATDGGAYRLVGPSEAFSVDGSRGRIVQRRAGASRSSTTPEFET
jgi:hypothetical protein